MNNPGDAARSGYLAELYPEMKALLDQGKPVCIGFRGMSMSPTLQGGRDEVILLAPKGRLRKYDLPLYRRDDGAFIMHRVIALGKDGTYTCCGDHQFETEPGVRDDQIIAVAEELVRKGRRISVHGFLYRLQVRFWCFLRPLRRPLFRAAGAVRKLLRRA